MEECSEVGCTVKHHKDGFCRRHWQWRNEAKTFEARKDRKCKFCEAPLPVEFRIDRMFCNLSCKMKWYRRHGCYVKETELQNRGSCRMPDCDNVVHAHGLCRAHDMRLWRHGDENYQLKEKQVGCSTKGCSNEHYCKGMCEKHYMKQYLEDNRQEWNAYRSARRRRIRQATPPWSNMKEIRKVYLACAKLTAETGIEYHVDHIIPLKGKLVCGLHVPANLQFLPGADNRRKSNKI